MPKEREVRKETLHLYCTDPRDGVAKFQFCAPKRAGSMVLVGEPRNHLGNLTVKVDQKAKAFHERLELGVVINDDLILECQARSLIVGNEDRLEIHNLEFGLAFPGREKIDLSKDDFSETEAASTEQLSLGALSLRANVADSTDLRLIPGEYLYEYDPNYFDDRRNPPKCQVHEKLYYGLCSVCKRASNDPLCHCRV